MSGIEPTAPKSTYVSNFDEKEMNKIDKMDDISIWNKFDTDGSGTISDKEITALGYVREMFNEVKFYLMERFGKDKVTNLTTADSEAQWDMQTAHDIPAGDIEEYKNNPTEYIKKLEAQLRKAFWQYPEDKYDIEIVETDRTGRFEVLFYSKEKKSLQEKKNAVENNYFDYNTFYQPVQVAQKLEDIPLGSHDGIRDARNFDISNVKLTKEELLNLCIDKTTVLSPEQKAIVDVYAEAAKNPGLGIRDLHEQGITGKGVNMAIIDYPLGKHKEYSDSIRELTDINGKDCKGWDEAQMHGASVTSIAVGKNVGIAPEAQVDYYSAVNVSRDPKEVEEYKQKILKELNNKNSTYNKDELRAKLADIEKRGQCISNRAHVEAINKILDKNKTLPPEERVSVISISWGFDPLAPGYDDLQKAIARAKEEGVFVVSTALERDYGFETCGANRNPQGDLESAESYEAGAFFKKRSEEYTKEYKDNLLLVPMDHRTVADYTDDSSYRYEGNDGGMSWSTPWLAGMYVLAKQVKPDITPEEFWQTAKATSDECHNNDTGTYVARLINPQKLIEALKTSEKL